MCCLLTTGNIIHKEYYIYKYTINILFPRVKILRTFFWPGLDSQKSWKREKRRNSKGNGIRVVPPTSGSTSIQLETSLKVRLDCLTVTSFQPGIVYFHSRNIFIQFRPSGTVEVSLIPSRIGQVRSIYLYLQLTEERKRKNINIAS